MLKKTTLICTCTVALILFALAIAAYRSFPAYSDERPGSHACESASNPVPVKRLSGESSDPFLFQGRTVSGDAQLYGRYRRSINRFPDLTSCLYESEPHANSPDVRLFAWQKIHSVEDAEVCMFRVFSSIGDPHKAKEWLIGQGFADAEQDIVPASVMRLSGLSQGEELPGVLVVASWPIDMCGYKFRESWPQRLSYKLAELFPALSYMGVLKPYSLSVGVTFTAGSRVDTVQATYNIL